MSAAIKSIVAALGPTLLVSIFLLMFSILVVVARGAFKFGKLTTLWEERANDIKSLRSLWDKDIPKIKTRISNLTIVVNQLSPGSLIKSDSPINLTEMGIKMSDELDANGIVENHADKLRELVEERIPKNAYDLQQECFAVIEENLEEILTHDQLETAKQTAVAHGILLGNALAVFGVVLRDKLLGEKGWNLDQVDKHNPKTNKPME